MPFLKAAALVGLFCLPGLAAEIPSGTPSSRNLFLLARELYGRGLLERIEYCDSPAATETGKNEHEKKLIRLYQHLIADHLGESDKPRFTGGLELIEVDRQKTSNINYIKLFPRIKVAINRNLSSTVVYRIDRELSDDARYMGKYWKGWAGFAENATLDLRLDHMGFRFGLERVSWGFGRYGNLMFSRQAMPMTVLGFSFRDENFDFESMVGFLSPVKEEFDRMEIDPQYITDQQRYISAHSLSFRPLRGLSFSLREAVIYGGPGRRFEPAYAVPLLWYHGYQLNSGIDDNTFVSLGFDYRHAGKLWAYGEVLIDDFQIEKETRGDYEPDQIGFLIGVETFDLGLGGSGIGLEYARINNWTYNQAHPHNRYINRNYPIGFPDGPDNDIVNWEYSWWVLAGLRLSYFGSVRRCGEGLIDTDWSAPWLYTDEYSEPFPTGVVQRELINGLRLLGLDKNRLWCNLEIHLADINNAGNVSGANETNWEFSVELGYRLPPFGWGF